MNYSYTRDSPIIGAGQGFQGAMVAYATMIAPLLTAMDKVATEENRKY